MNIEFNGISKELAESAFSGWISPEPDSDLISLSATINPVVSIVVYDSMLVIATDRGVHKIDRHDFGEVIIS